MADDIISDEEMNQMVQNGEAFAPQQPRQSAQSEPPQINQVQFSQPQGDVISDEEMARMVKAGEAQPADYSDADMERMLRSGEARPASHLKSNAAGAFARSAIEGVAPAVGALPAVGPGFAAGAAIGGAVAGPPGAAVGGFVGALGAGMGAGYLVSKGQDWVMDQLGLREGHGFFSREQQQADIEQHPYWSTAGGVASGIVPFGGAPVAVGRAMTAAEKLTARKAALLSSGVFAGQEAGTELYNEGTIDPGRVAIAGAGGYLLSHPRKFASDIIQKTTDASGLAKYSDKYFAGRPGVPITDVDATAKDAVDSTSGKSPPATSDSRATASDRTNVDKNETDGASVPGVGNAAQGPGVTDGRPDYRKPAGAQRANNGVNVGSVFADIQNQLKGAANSVDTERTPILNQQPTEAAAAEAEKYRGSHIEVQVRAMAEQGKTATEIANFTGLAPNVVRFLRGDLKPGSETELPPHSKAAQPAPEITPNVSEINPPPAADVNVYGAQHVPEGPPVDAPVPSYIQANRENAVKQFSGKPVEQVVLDMARRGRTAKQIAEATGLDTDTVRTLRDKAGIAAAGPTVYPGGAVQEASRPQAQLKPGIPGVGRQAEAAARPAAAPKKPVAAPKFEMPSAEEMYNAGFTDSEIRNPERLDPAKLRQVKEGYKYFNGQWRKATYDDLLKYREGAKKDAENKARDQEVIDAALASFDPRSQTITDRAAFNKMNATLGSDWQAAMRGKDMSQLAGWKQATSEALYHKYKFNDAVAKQLEAIVKEPKTEQTLELGKGIPGVKGAPTADRTYRKVTQDVLKRLDASPAPEFHAVAKAIREAKTAAERDQMTMRAQAVLSGSEVKQGTYEQVRTRKDYTLSNGEVAANPKDLKRKQASLDARQKVWEDERFKTLPVEYGDATPEGKQKLVDWAKQVNQAAIDAGGGAHPIDTYKHKDAPYRWLDATRKLLNKGGTSPKRLQEFYATVKQLREGGEEGLKNVADTRKIEAGIEKQRMPTTEEVEEQIAQPRTSERAEFEMLPEWKPGAEESKPYIDASNELRKWVNELPEDQYAKLEGQHPNLAHDIELTQDPEHLLDVYQTGLENAPERPAKAASTKQSNIVNVPAKRTGEPDTMHLMQNGKVAGSAIWHSNTQSYRVRVGKDFFWEPDEFSARKALEGARSTVNQIKDIIATKQAAAAPELNEGRVLDKNSPEFKAIAARAAAEATARAKATGELPPAQQKKQAAVKPQREETAEELVARYNAEPDKAKAIQDIIGSMKSMLSDESGKVMLPAWLVERLTRKPSDQYHSATLTSEEAKTAGAISDDMHILDQTDVNGMMTHLQNAEKMPEGFKDSAVQEDVYTARDTNTIDNLSPEVKGWYETHLRPIFDENNMLYQWAKALNPKLMEELNLNHIHRLMVGRSLIDWVNDPVSGAKRSLFTMVGPLMDRQFKAIHEKGTDRRGVISPEKDQSGFTLWDRGEALRVPVPEFDFKNGFEFKIGNREYVVTEAMTHEIEAHARDSEGNMVKYYKNAALSAIVANTKLKSAIRHMLYLQSLTNSAEWAKFATRVKPDPHDPVKGDWDQTILTQLKDWYMDPKLKAVFDDYAQPGFGGNRGLDWTRDISRAVTKLMFWLPSPHILNVGAHWWVARDWRWLQPMAYKDLATSGVEAIRSVVLQDEFQQQMRHLGAGTLSGGIITTDFARKVAREFGMQIKREPTKWDPVVRSLGLEGVRELTDAIYRGSSRVMWAANDMFLTQLVKENMKRGMDMKEAIIAAERHIPNYRVPIEIMGSRFLSQFMQDPLFSAFGRYRYGVFNSYAHIVKGLVNGTKEQKIEAVGNLMAMGMLAFLVYPVANKWAQWLTGNKEAEQRPRGPLAIPTHLFRATASRDKPEGWATFNKATLTMPPLPSAILEAYNNRDWADRPIRQEGRIRGVKDAARRIEQTGEHLARSLISPLGSAENAIGRKEPIGDALRDMLFDIKNPSRKAIAYEHKLDRRNIQQANRRSIKPPGQGEALFNWLFGRGP